MVSCAQIKSVWIHNDFLSVTLIVPTAPLEPPRQPNIVRCAHFRLPGGKLRPGVAISSVQMEPVA